MKRRSDTFKEFSNKLDVIAKTPIISSLRLSKQTCYMPRSGTHSGMRMIYGFLSHLSFVCQRVGVSSASMGTIAYLHSEI